MSEENVEVVRRTHTRLERTATSRPSLESFDPTIRAAHLTELPDLGVFIGHDGVHGGYRSGSMP